MTPDRLDYLRDELRAAAADIVSLLFGEAPVRTRQGELRWHSRGSFRLKERAGIWSDFEDGGNRRGDGWGDMLDLIRRERGCTFPEALKWACSYLGWPDEDDATPRAATPDAEREYRRQQREAERAEQARRDAEERAASISKAAAIWRRAVHIENTIAEIYLTETRKIPPPATGWPRDVMGFDPIGRALVIRIVENGDTVAIQRIRLDAAGQKSPDGEGLVKRTYGVIGGGAAVLPGATGQGPVLAGEGPETGLSAWAATQRETWISFGSLANVEPPDDRPLVLLREHDLPKAKSRQALDREVANWRAEGRDVREAWPFDTPPKKGADFNDLIQAEGSGAVRARIEAVCGAKFADKEVCHHDLDTPMEAFWRGAEEDSAALLRHALAGPAALGVEPRRRQHLARVALGLGKTETACRNALRFVAGDFVSATLPRPDGIARRVLILVNDHGLGEDLLRRLDAMQPGCAQIWRGLERRDPLCPSVRLCRRFDDFAEVKKAGGGIDVLCGTKKSGFCPFHLRAGGEETCGYRAQADEGRAILILAGPKGLTQAHPPKFRRTVENAEGKDVPLPPFDAIVIDETRPAELMHGLEQRPVRVAMGALASRLDNPRDARKPLGADDLEHANERLERCRKLLNTVAGKRAPLRLGDLRAVGMEASDWRSFRETLYRLARPVPDAAGLTGTALQAALSDVTRWNGRIFGLARLAFCAAQALSDNEGRSDDTLAGQIETETGGEGAAFILAWREPVHKAYRALPTLVLDGTGDVELLRPWLSRLELTADVSAGFPAAVEVIQVRDQVNGYRGWTPQGDADAEDATKQDKTADNNLHRLARFLEALGQRYGRVAAIVPQAAENWLRALWAGREPLPVELAHFGKIRGFDGFRDVRCLVVWSRPEPGPLVVERMAAVHRGRWGGQIERGEWYAKSPASFRMRGGAEIATTTDRHLDDLAERFRWQSTEAELLQAAGRGRGVRRDASSPLKIIIGTSVPLPLEVDRLVGMKELMAEATPVDRLIGSGVVPMAEKGQWALFAAALGKTPRQWRNWMRFHPEVEGRLEHARSVRGENAHIVFSMGVFAFESTEWLLRLNPDDRYRAGVFLDGVKAGDTEAALLKLASVGVVPAAIEAARKPETTAGQQTRPGRVISVTVSESCDTADIVGVVFAPRPAEEQPIWAPDLEPDPIPFPAPEPVIPDTPPSRAWQVGYWRPRDYTAEGEDALSAFDDDVIPFPDRRSAP